MSAARPKTRRSPTIRSFERTTQLDAGRHARADRLIEVAIALFGRDGEAAVGTRAIAEAAGVQMSAITYHFGGKEGLYLACAGHIAAIMRARVADLVDGFESASTPADACRRIEAIVGGFVDVMTPDAIAPMARFVVREQMNPTAAFDVLYDGAIRRVVEPLAALLGIVAGDRLGQEARLVGAFALLSPALACRFGRATLMRAAGWDLMGDREAAVMREVSVENARAVMRALSGGPVT